MKKDVVERQMFNKSYTYIQPLLSEYMDVRREGLINVFIGSTEKPEYDLNIFMLYRYSGNLDFVKYEDYVETSPLFLEKYDPDKYHVMFILRVPERFKEVYKSFKEGKYSRFPKTYKTLILMYHNIIDSNHKVAKVLYRHTDLREELEDRIGTFLPEGSEVSSIPDMSLEVYTDSMKIKDPLKPNKNPFE